MIYLFTDHTQISDDLLKTLSLKMPESRRNRFMHYKKAAAKQACVLGYMVFLYGFRHLYNQPGFPDFDISESGKPYLKAYPHIHFNISHCNGGACCFFASAPVGIDIQEKRKFPKSILKKVCNEDELDAIAKADDSFLEFCRIWSQKESISKISGDGIFRDLMSISSKDCISFTKYLSPDKYLTASSYDKAVDFNIINLTVEDFLSL